MYTRDQRDDLRSALIAAARNDARITGAALTGSAAGGAEDQWSDIDLAFGIGDAGKLPAAMADWTERMYRDHGAVHHFDVNRGAWIYRVFLLDIGLQVDLAFVPAGEFGARAPTFRLLFGDAVERPHASPPAPSDLIGLAWVYALHARGCIGRGNLWQAEYMISLMRDEVLALACLRHGLPAVEGKGMDRLPPSMTALLQGALVGHLDQPTLGRAFRATTDALIQEIRYVDSSLAARLERVLLQMPGDALDTRASG
ncbi:MAG: nucleotidyltransferase domain-containing protein [Bacillati bacterium ANGP1]|uniref:Nucleotidyltransferase domain-containing protein n=1 Tax=Candidatus Segetimicrobium genomatis TaxID=2569760 RepID=A0A537IHL3_9BACT|nr:MAG: nucleotidyltransferase domain-containing protein [Terrabacteria group bacterium ANGP1]